MDRATRVYDNIFQLLPDVDNPTPLVRVNRLNTAGDGFPIYAKLEWYNPIGSVKDRAAWAMIQDLESKGLLRGTGFQPVSFETSKPSDNPNHGLEARATKGMVEPTSGNTGISLAALAGARGHSVRAIVPRKVPTEKRAMLRLAGATVDVINDQLCPAPGLGEGAINLAKTYERAQGDLYTMPNQYENEQNSLAHERTTGPEIWRQTAGKVTHVFVALGTCGTAMGLSRFLKRQKPGIKVIAVTPTPGHDVPGLRGEQELGVSKLFDRSLVDEIIEIDHELAYRRAADLFRTEGLRAGPSSGLIFEAARRVADRTIAAGSTGHGVAIFCDDAFKYASSFAKHLPELAEDPA